MFYDPKTGKGCIRGVDEPKQQCIGEPFKAPMCPFCKINPIVYQTMEGNLYCIVCWRKFIGEI